MTKTYCTACGCYDIKWGMARGCDRNCTHPKGPGKLENPRTPETCPLEIKKKFTLHNSDVLFSEGSFILGVTRRGRLGHV